MLTLFIYVCIIGSVIDDLKKLRTDKIILSLQASLAEEAHANWHPPQGSNPARTKAFRRTCVDGLNALRAEGHPGANAAELVSDALVAFREEAELKVKALSRVLPYPQDLLQYHRANAKAAHSVGSEPR